MRLDYDISIGFSTTKQVVSRFIRWFTGSSCSHTFIAFHDYALNMRMVMQAESFGFELVPWRKWINNNILVAEFRPAAHPLDDALLYIAELLGAEFDFKSAILIGLKSKFTKWYQSHFSLNPNMSPSKLTCSEAVIRFLNKGGYRAIEGLDPETTSPGQLLREILKSEGQFEPLYVNKIYLNYDRKMKRSPIDYDFQLDFKQIRDKEKRVLQR